MRPYPYPFELHSKQTQFNYVKHLVEKSLSSIGKSPFHLGLKKSNYKASITTQLPSSTQQCLKSHLNEEQMHVFNAVLKLLKSNKASVMFLQARAGTGKTFLVKCLLSSLSGTDIEPVVSATTGMAASLLPFARTAHSTYGIPVVANVSDLYNQQPILTRIKRLARAKLHIIDEISAFSKYHIDFLCRTIWSVNPNATIIFAGDIRQGIHVD